MSEQKIASLDQLKKKGPVRKEATVVIDLDSGETQEFTLVFQSIGNKAYDDLMAKYPPNKKQKEQGLNYDLEKFAPALLSECLIEPEMTLEDAKEIWESEHWNRGELMNLFFTAVQVNTAGHELPSSESG